MEKLTALLRVLVLFLVVLLLIPVVLHLWGGLIDGFGSTWSRWELFNIGNDY